MKVLVVGGGKMGTFLCSLLLERGHEVKLIENRAEKIPAMRRDLPEEVIVIGNGTSPETLESAGIRQMDVVAAATGSDETNLVVATLARMEYGVRRVVARVNNPKNARLFTPDLGVDVGLNQAELMARFVAEELSLRDMMTLVKIHGGHYSLVEKSVQANSEVAGKAVKDIPLPDETVLVAIIRKNELLIPRGDTIFLAEDQVIALTNTIGVDKLSELLQEAPAV